MCQSAPFGEALYQTLQEQIFVIGSFYFLSLKSLSRFPVMYITFWHNANSIIKLFSLSITFMNI